MEYLKLRAWDVVKNKMLFFGIYSLLVDGIENNPEWSEYYNVSRFNDLRIMRNTLIDDTKGKEIFFGDIIKFSFHDVQNTMEDYSGTALVIETMGGGAGILHEHSKNSRTVFAVREGGICEDIWEDETLWTFEIIGNRYTNPELIHEYSKLR